MDLIDKEDWSGMSAEVKGNANEGCSKRTPKLIQAMVDCVAPKPGETIRDPVCGTGEWLLAGMIMW